MVNKQFYCMACTTPYSCTIQWAILGGQDNPHFACQHRIWFIFHACRAGHIIRLQSASEVTDAQVQPNDYIILYLYFQGQQCQKDKVGPNLLQKAKKSLTSSFESFRSKRVRSDFVVILKEKGMISDLSLLSHGVILHICASCFEVFSYQQPKIELVLPNRKH